MSNFQTKREREKLVEKKNEGEVKVTERDDS